MNIPNEVTFENQLYTGKKVVETKYATARIVDGRVVFEGMTGTHDVAEDDMHRAYIHFVGFCENNRNFEVAGSINP